MRYRIPAICLVVLGCSSIVAAAEMSETAESAADTRILVEMPLEAQRNLSLDMREHLAALNDVILRIAADDWDGAAEVAEAGLGFSSMGKFRGSPMAPGRHMPDEMRAIGRSMHAAASAFAEAAQQGDTKDAKRQLSSVTSGCVACHMSFRIR